MDICKVTLTGRIGNEIEMKESQNGKSFCRVSLAVNNKKNETIWFSVFFFEKKAEIIQNYCQKGSKILVIGELSQNNYTKDGVEKQSLSVLSNDFLLLDKKDQERKEESEFGF
jgi:single-strand DNA-binding protein